jgi:hypothetical protein
MLTIHDVLYGLNARAETSQLMGPKDDAIRAPRLGACHSIVIVITFFFASLSGGLTPTSTGMTRSLKETFAACCKLSLPLGTIISTSKSFASKICFRRLKTTRTESTFSPARVLSDLMHECTSIRKRCRDGFGGMRVRPTHMLVRLICTFPSMSVAS